MKGFTLNMIRKKNYLTTHSKKKKKGLARTSEGAHNGVRIVWLLYSLKSWERNKNA